MTVPTYLPIHLLRAALVAAAAVLLTPESPAEDVAIQGLTRNSATEIVLAFNDAEPGIASDYAVESSADLAAESWSPLPSVAVSTGPTGWQITATLPEAATAAYFRITKNGVPLTASLQGDLTTIAEGASDPGLTVQFTGPFTGELFYTIDYLDGGPPVAGSVAVSGATSARIPIVVPADDDEASPDGRVTVKLRTSGTADYGLGNLTSLTLSLIDNDSYWDGLLEEGSGGPTFSLRMIAQGGSFSAAFVGSGTNIFPSGIYGMSDFTFTPGATFSATTDPITIPAGATPIGADMQLAVALTANHSDVPGSDLVVEDDRIIGTYILTQTVPDKAFLNQTRTGTFRLLRRIIVTPTP